MAGRRRWGGGTTIGLDVIGGSAGSAEAMLAAAGYRLVHVSGLAVNRARQGTAAGGGSRSDPRDARVIADQVRIRRDLRPIEAETELDLDIRLLVGRRRDLWCTIRPGASAGGAIRWWPSFPAWNGRRATPPRGRRGCGVSRYVTPAGLRAAGRRELIRHLHEAGGPPNVEAPADAAVAAAEAQTVAVPGGTRERNLDPRTGHRSLGRSPAHRPDRQGARGPVEEPP